MAKLKIVLDEYAHNTKVFTEEGETIDNIEKIEIDPIVPGEIIRATITVIMLEVEAIANCETVFNFPIYRNYVNYNVDKSEDS